MATAEGRKTLLATIQSTIERFEPRLTNTVVRLVDGGTSNMPLEVHFIIQATLLMDPSPEQVVFDTVLEVGRGEYEVHEGRPAGASA